MKNIIIFSVFRLEFADKNEVNHKSVITALNDLGIVTIEVVGSYKGESEKSIVVPLNDYSYEQVITFANLFNQESILVVDKNSQAKLIFPVNFDVMKLGTMKQVSKEYALNQDAYTFVPSTNQYFLAE